MLRRLAVIAAAAPALASANPLEFDPGLPWVTPGGVGQGRAAYFTADEAFSITHAAFMCDMPAGSYQVLILQGAGEFAPRGLCCTP